MLLPNPQPATGKASVCLSIQSAWTLATSTVLLSRRIEKKWTTPSLLCIWNSKNEKCFNYFTIIKYYHY